MISLIDGLKTFCQLFEIEYFGWMKPIVSFYESHLPLYNEGLGWLLPVLIIILLTGIYARVAGGVISRYEEPN
jgi:LIVCS family branched-chain amino acid:cation transporter